MKESHLRWFGHVQRIAINASVRKSELIQINGIEKRWRKTKILLLEVIKKKCELRN